MPEPPTSSSLSFLRRVKPGLCAAVSLGALLTASPARAQQDDPIEGEFSVQRFNPAPGPRNFFVTRGARTDGEMAWSAGAFANYAFEPFVVVSCRSETDCDDPNAVRSDDVKVVENLVALDLMGSLTPIPRLQVSLRVPLTMVDGQGTETLTRSSTKDLSAFALGDPELEGKFRLHGAIKDPFVVGAGAFATLHGGKLSSEGNFAGDESPTAGLRGIFDGSEGPFAFGGNLAGVYRATGRVGSTEIGPEFRYSVAVGYRLSPAFRFVVDAFGGTKFQAENGTNTMEADGGLQVTPHGSPLVISAGAGTGVIQGVGVPKLRAFLGIVYVAERRDRDGDDIYDDDDQCPTEPEDKDGYEDGDGCPDQDNDGDTIADSADKCPREAEDSDAFEDLDGCPEPDNDKDGVLDASDRCPDKAETRNGYKDDDGCPDEPDADNDGVSDAKDKCPKEPEDTDGKDDTDGCPDPDNDGDGIPDTEDECIDEPETKNGVADEDGCPDEGAAGDKDGDGIPDARDRCPNEPEDKNGVKDNDGCPDAEKPLVSVTATAIELRGTVNFAVNDTKIVGKKSFEILDAVAGAMSSHPEIEQVEVAGHTDDRGNPDKNMKLSDGRAAACKDYLVKKGIAADRLVSRGYGPTKPIADNKTPAGREQNRRVEFVILKRK